MNPNIDKLTDKQKAFALLRTSGMTQAEAGKALGMTARQSAHTMEKRIEKKAGKLTHEDIRSSFFASPARKALKKILKGEIFGDMDKMPAGVVLDAVKLVKEEISPKVTRAVVTHNSVLSPKIIDVEPIIDDD